MERSLGSAHPDSNLRPSETAVTKKEKIGKVERGSVVQIAGRMIPVFWQPFHVCQCSISKANNSMQSIHTTSRSICDVFCRAQKTAHCLQISIDCHNETHRHPNIFDILVPSDKCILILSSSSLS